MLQKAEEINYHDNFSVTQLGYVGHDLKRLITFAKTGKYKDLYDQCLSDRFSDSYLESLGKCHHGYNSIANNNYETIELMRKHGRPAYKKRLAAFLKKKIGNCVKV